MKSLNILKVLLSGFCGQIGLISCTNDQLVNTCGGKVVLQITDYPCQILDTILNPLYVVQIKPMFGENDSDLEEYLKDKINICGLSEVEEGEIRIAVVINYQGVPCASEITCSNVFMDSHLGLQNIINSMPNWKSGIPPYPNFFVKSGIIMQIRKGEVVHIGMD